MTIAEWMEEHPEAKACVAGWLEARGRRQDVRGQRRIVRDLKREFGFPFTSQPTFAKWLRRTFQRSYEHAVEGARKAPAARVRLDDHAFARSDADVHRLEKATDFVITCAQNNTEPEWNFLNALERYAKERGARLVVIPMRYANPTSKRDPQEEKSEDYWWHEALHEYLVENELRIHQHLRIMGDVRIQAIAVHPLSGLESRSRDASAIYGHPQLAMQSVATPQHRLPKLLYTTGSVTKKNYSRTKQGNLAAFHHTHGAVVAEVRGDVAATATPGHSTATRSRVRRAAPSCAPLVPRWSQAPSRL